MHKLHIRSGAGTPKLVLNKMTAVRKWVLEGEGRGHVTWRDGHVTTTDVIVVTWCDGENSPGNDSHLFVPQTAWATTGEQVTWLNGGPATSRDVINYVTWHMWLRRSHCAICPRNGWFRDMGNVVAITCSLWWQLQGLCHRYMFTVVPTTQSMWCLAFLLWWRHLTHVYEISPFRVIP